ncbi:MAG: DNA-formamidopyrimidine glycosylase [Thermomicrobiales bacterium]
MPELPEVETVRRSLAPSVVGRTIVGLRVGAHQGVLGGSDPAVVGAAIANRTIVDLRRLGKYLILDLDDGSHLLAHLRMTGQLVVCPRGSDALRFEHLAIVFDDGAELRFADQRKFGRVLFFASGLNEHLQARLGPEPLGVAFTAAAFAAALVRRTAPIKAVLLDQKTVAGIGNIYADEALFLASIHPRRPANALTPAEQKRLHRAIRQVLRDGIAHRGTSFSSYRDGNGAEGDNQHRLKVYGRGRTGGACVRCRHPLEFLTVAGRTSHYCPACQPAAGS